MTLMLIVPVLLAPFLLVAVAGLVLRRRSRRRDLRERMKLRSSAIRYEILKSGDALRRHDEHVRSVMDPFQW